jgi:hypothetical protein
MARSASGGGHPTISPVVEGFEVNEDKASRGGGREHDTKSSQNTLKPYSARGLLGIQSAGSSPLAVQEPTRFGRQEESDDADVTFDTSAYYGQPSPLRQAPLAGELDVISDIEPDAHSDLSSMDSVYDDETDPDLEDVLMAPNAPSDTPPERADPDDLEAGWDITMVQLLEIQHKLVHSAREVRRAMTSHDELSPRPSPNFGSDAVSRLSPTCSCGR